MIEILRAVSLLNELGLRYLYSVLVLGFGFASSLWLRYCV